MKALLLAAGFGTRLGHLTKSKPKCLLEIAGQSMLDHWLLKLNTLGVEQFFVNTHYLADQVEKFVSCHILKDKITLIKEPKLLGTSRTLFSNSRLLFDDECFIVHVDNYCEDNLVGFLKNHQSNRPKRLMSMLTFVTNTPSACGIVKQSPTGLVTNFEEKPLMPTGNIANAAVYLVNKAFFEEIKNYTMKSGEISLDIIPNLIGKIITFKTDEYFDDIGRPKNLRAAIDHANEKIGV